MFVRVLAGTVLAGGLWITPSLPAAEKTSRAARAASQNRKIVGIVTAKTDKDIMVKAEGESEAKRYLLAEEGAKPQADLQAALKQVFVSNLVALQWQGEQQPVLTGIHAFHSPARFGMVVGTVAAVEAAGNMPSFDVTPSGRGFTERYVPSWDVAAKGWNKGVVGTIAALNVGDKVKVAWSYDERNRAVQIQVLSRPKPKQAKKEAKPDQTP
jgi:acylphosphatase